MKMLDRMETKKDNFQITSLHLVPKKKWQAIYITPLRPITFAAFPPWRILRSWLCRTCRCKDRNKL